MQSMWRSNVQLSMEMPMQMLMDEAPHPRPPTEEEDEAGGHEQDANEEKGKV